MSRLSSYVLPVLSLTVVSRLAKLFHLLRGHSQGSRIHARYLLLSKVFSSVSLSDRDGHLVDAPSSNLPGRPASVDMHIRSEERSVLWNRLQATNRVRESPDAGPAHHS
jgi:hypothetical protein